MQKLSPVILLILMGFVTTVTGRNLYMGGYMQGNPVYIRADFPPAGEVEWIEYRLQNRLNIRWGVTQALSFHWQMRTRLFAGDLVKEVPGYAGEINQDDGIADLSWMIAEYGNWFLHYIPDRLYAEWHENNWNFRLGRQRINWGINMVTNPNDIFNIYSFYDFDYRERPGSDAFRMQRHLGFGSRAEIAMRPGREIKNSTIAGLYAFHVRGYDVQAIAGYYRERLTTGGGWAGNLGSAGFKGELMFYADIEEENGSRETNFISAVSFDYMFSNGLFTVGELLYNKSGGQDDFFLMTEELRPDNPSFSRYQTTLHLTYPIHPLLDGSISAIYYFDESAVFLSPSITWSVLQDLDFQLLAQFFAGSDDSAFARAGNLISASLRYNY